VILAVTAVLGGFSLLDLATWFYIVEYSLFPWITGTVAGNAKSKITASVQSKMKVFKKS